MPQQLQKDSKVKRQSLKWMAAPIASVKGASVSGSHLKEGWHFQLQHVVASHQDLTRRCSLLSGCGCSTLWCLTGVPARGPVYPAAGGSAHCGIFTRTSAQRYSLHNCCSLSTWWCLAVAQAKGSSLHTELLHQQHIVASHRGPAKEIQFTQLLQIQHMVAPRHAGPCGSSLQSLSSHSHRGDLTAVS